MREKEDGAMQKGTRIVVAVLLLAAGIGVGVVLQRTGLLGDSAGPGGEPAPPGEAAATAPKDPGKARPSVEDDQRALEGLWIMPRPTALPRIFHFTEGFLQVCDFGDDERWRTFSGDCYPQERDGERVLLGFEGAVIFRYRLDGDILELLPPPTPRAELGRPYDNYQWNLEGKWYRLKYRPSAEPGAAPGGGGK
jgi:hypothetical protein